MRKRKKRAEHGKEDSIFLKRICEWIDWYLNIIVVKSWSRGISKGKEIHPQNRDQKIIVSLTSFPKRIKTVWITIESLIRQSVKPDMIILWLASSQFEGIECLPEELRILMKRGLTIRFCDDLLSHKKYYYVMQEYPKDIIVLADDDMFYPPDTIARLLSMHGRFPEDICTITAQKIDPCLSANPSKWRNPYLGEVFEHSSDIQIFSGSGSLYPPGSIPSKAFDLEKITVLCPYADDLWLTYMAFLNKTKITTLRKWRAFPVSIYGTSEDSLWYINAEEGKNDLQWEAIIKEFRKDQDWL